MFDKIAGVLVAALVAAGIVGVFYMKAPDFPQMQHPASTNKVEGTQHVRKHVVPPPRSPHYERWVDLPMNKPVRGTTRWYREAISPRIKCKDLGKPNRFDTLSEWDEPRISTARLCVRQGYHR